MSEQMTLEPRLMWDDNRRRIAGLLAVFLTLCAAEGAILLLVVPAAWVVALPVLLGIAYVLVSWRIGDRWILGVLGAASEAPPRVRSFADALTGGGVRVLVAPGEAPNAIAFALHTRAVVVTDGSLHLPDLEQEALVAHEVVHVRGGDATLATLYVVVAGAVELAMRGVVASMVALPIWPACLAVRVFGRLATSRDRESRADVGGAVLTRYPPGMRRALLALAVEHSDSTLRVTDPFWTAPRVPDGTRALHDRAERVAEM